MATRRRLYAKCHGNLNLCMHLTNFLAFYKSRFLEYISGIIINSYEQQCSNNRLLIMASVQLSTVSCSCVHSALYFPRGEMHFLL